MGELKERFISVYNNAVHRDGSDMLLRWLEDSDFFVAPASTKFHGCHEGGLLQHSLNVYDCLKRGRANPQRFRRFRLRAARVRFNVIKYRPLPAVRIGAAQHGLYAHTAYQLQPVHGVHNVPVVHSSLSQKLHKSPRNIHILTKKVK